MTSSTRPTHTSDPTPTTLGGWLRKWRGRAGLTQAQVASRLGVVQTTISFWESDRHEVGVQSLQVLAELYGVSSEELGVAVLGSTDVLQAVAA